MGIKESSLVDGVKEYTLESWTDFLSLTSALFAVSPAYIYRGQAKYDWQLESGLDRLERRFPRRKNLGGRNPEYFDSPPLTEEDHLHAFKNALRGRRGPNPPVLSDDEYWALGQHHGLATPLLDFTRSPFAALFFAFEEEKILADDTLTAPDFRGVYALSTCAIDDTVSEPAQHLSIISPEGDSNFRLISQGALFVRLPRKTHVEGYVNAYFTGDYHRAIFTKIKIPNKDRDDCLVALNKMNINHITLFPDIQGAAKHVNSLWQPGHEDSIAWV
jgi:hypothetical protein